MPNVAFQLYMGRSQSGYQVSGISYGAATEFVFEDPASGAWYTLPKDVADTNEAKAGEAVQISLQRDADDGNNTTASDAAAFLLVLSVPVT